jgi:hypothetical protein
VDAATAGLIGALGGTVVGGAITWSVERQRLLQAERTRWHDERRVVYAALLKAMQIQRLVLEEPGQPKETVLRAAGKSWSDAELALGDVLLEINLLASANVRHAAYDWYRVLLHWAPEPDDAAQSEYMRAETTFLTAVHTELGIPAR